MFSFWISGSIHIPSSAFNEPTDKMTDERKIITTFLMFMFKIDVWYVKGLYLTIITIKSREKNEIYSFLQRCIGWGRLRPFFINPLKCKNIVWLGDPLRAKNNHTILKLFSGRFKNGLHIFQLPDNCNRLGAMCFTLATFNTVGSPLVCMQHTVIHIFLAEHRIVVIKSKTNRNVYTWRAG